MERVFKFNHENKEYKLVFTSDIELDFLEEYELNSIFDLLEMPGSKRIKGLMDLLSRMNEKAGGEQIKIPDPVFPADLMDFQEAILETIMLGHRRDVPSQEIDVGLAELEKKKEEPRARTSWFFRALACIFQSGTHTTPRRE